MRKEGTSYPSPQLGVGTRADPKFALTAAVGCKIEIRRLMQMADGHDVSLQARAQRSPFQTDSPAPWRSSRGEPFRRSIHGGAID